MEPSTVEVDFLGIKDITVVKHEDRRRSYLDEYRGSLVVKAINLIARKFQKMDLTLSAPLSKRRRKRRRKK